MLNLGIFISGRGSNLRAIYRAIKQKKLDAQINLVVSNNPDAAGFQWAKDEGLLTVCLSRNDFTTEQEFISAMLKELEDHGVNFIALAGYIAKLPAEVVRKYYPNILNIHPALLPLFGGKGWYGQIPLKAAIESGMKFTGVTVHIVNEEYDAGPIVYQQPLEIKPEDTPETLEERSLKLQWEIYPYILQLFAQRKIKLKDDRVRILSTQKNNPKR